MQVIEKNSNNVRNTSTIVIDLLLLCQILIGDNRIIILDTKLSTAKLILCKVRQKFPPPSLPLSIAIDITHYFFILLSLCVKNFCTGISRQEILSGFYLDCN